MRVFAIDPSLTATGVALLDGHTAHTHTITSRGRRDDTIEARDRRITDMAQAATRWGYPLIVGAHHLDPELVVIEGPSLGSRGGSAWDRAGLWWRIVHGLPVDRLAIVPPQTRAKWATGKGNADKAAVAAVAARLCPDVDLPTSDAADALILALMGAHALGARPDLHTAYRGQALLACQWPSDISERLLHPYEIAEKEAVDA